MGNEEHPHLSIEFHTLPLPVMLGLGEAPLSYHTIHKAQQSKPEFQVLTIF